MNSLIVHLQILTRSYTISDVMSIGGSNESIKAKPQLMVAEQDAIRRLGANVIDANSLSKRSIWQWFHPDDGPTERKLIVKLDFYILSFACIGFWVSLPSSSRITF